MKPVDASIYIHCIKTEMVENLFIGTLVAFPTKNAWTSFGLESKEYICACLSDPFSHICPFMP
jgi:hypothetical protein